VSVTISANTSSQHATDPLDIKGSAVHIILHALGLLEIDQERTIILDQEVARVRVSMGEAEIIKPFQNSLTLVGIALRWCSSTVEPLDGEANDPAFFGDIAQEFRRDPPVLDVFVGLALCLEERNVILAPSQFDDYQTPIQALSGHVDSRVVTLPRVETQVPMIEAFGVPSAFNPFQRLFDHIAEVSLACRWISGDGTPVPVTPWDRRQ
jgi:hypothetical protein